MKRLALILSLVLLASLCSCSTIKRKINPPIEDAGEVITAPVRPDTDDLDTTDPKSSGSDTEESTDANDGARDSVSLGSAGTLDGRTVVISVFANDLNTRWVDSEEDIAMKDLMLKYVKTACDFISAKAEERGVKSEFICDWNENDYLKYTVNYDSYEMLVDDSSRYSHVSTNLLNNLNVNNILRLYQAEDIVYLFFYNTDVTNEIRPNSLSHVNSPDFDVEYCTIPVRVGEEVTSPATIAHEILHCFGAYDLYATGDTPIGADYIAHLEEEGSQDIMRYVNSGDEILSTFSDLDAYYTGLTDECAEVAEWDLPVAERLIAK